MRVCIVSNEDRISAAVRQILLRQGFDCPAAHIYRLELLPEKRADQLFDVAIVILSPEPERAIGLFTELRMRVQGRILAVGPGDDPKLILRVLREGADQYVDESDLEREFEAALARIRGATNTAIEAGHVISVLAPNGGSGSSTIAANIATVLAKAHSKCALFDLNLENGDLPALLDLRPIYTLADISKNVATLDRTMLERSLVRHSSGVQLLAPPRSFEDVALVTPEAVRQAVMLARTMFPYVVVDLDHSFRAEQVQVIRQSDVLVLVIRLDFASLKNAKRAIEQLGRLGIGSERIRLVVNRFGQPKEVDAKEAEEALGRKILHYIPDEPKTINQANNSGVPLVLEFPRTRVARSVTELAASINGRPPSHR